MNKVIEERTKRTEWYRDAAIRAVRLLTSKMADAVLEGRQGQQEEAAAAEEAGESAENAEETAEVPAEDKE